MTLTVEDGTGVTGADAYVSTADATSYFVGRRLFSAGWSAAISSDQEVALRQASVLLDNEFTWVGSIPVSTTQGLAWPFTDALDKYNNPITGVPKQVIDATCEVALYLLAQDRLQDQEGVGIKRLRVDAISLEFDKTEMPRTFPPHVARMLLGLGFPVKGSLRNIKLNRV